MLKQTSVGSWIRITLGTYIQSAFQTSDLQGHYGDPRDSSYGATSQSGNKNETLLQDWIGNKRVMNITQRHIVSTFLWQITLRCKNFHSKYARIALVGRNNLTKTMNIVLWVLRTYLTWIQLILILGPSTVMYAPNMVQDMIFARLRQSSAT